MSGKTRQSSLATLRGRLKEYVTQPSAFRVFALVVRPAADTATIASRLANEFKGKHVDVLADKIRALQPRLGLYSPADLKSDIGAWSREAKSLLVVLEMEAVLDTWNKQQQQGFFRMLARWRTNTPILLIVSLNLPFEELLGEGRVFRLE